MQDTLEVKVAGQTIRLLSPPGDTGDLYWNVLWPAAVGLGEHLIEMGPERLGDCRVLELGTGVGLIGIVAARLGADLTISDIDETALALAQQNLQANGVEGVAQALIDWNAPPTLEPFDLILGSDLGYEPWLVAPLAYTIDALLAPDGRALLADPIRATFNQFLECARAHHLEYRQELRDVEALGREHVVGIYTLRRARRRKRRRASA